MFRLQRCVLNDEPRNVLSLEVLARLESELLELAAEDTDAIVLSSRLTWGFSAGVDLKDHVPERVPAMLGAVHGLLRKMSELPCLLIAQVHGPCLGGAAELVFHCDAVIAAHDASFGFPEIHAGCYPPVAVATLASRIGLPRAIDLILSGRRFDAQEALAWGLVTQVVERDVKEEAVLALVEQLCGQTSRATRRHTLLTLRRIHHRAWEDALKQAEVAYLTLPPEDQAEGVAAFLEKRPAHWRNA